MKRLIKNGYAPLIIGVAISLGIYLGDYISPSNSSTTGFDSNIKTKKIQRLLNYIDNEYVDKVNTDSILDIAINDVLKNLDPHSTYITAKMHQSIKENMEGSFVGVGVQFRIYRDTVFVINVLKGGPSQKAGIHNGDRILIANSDTLYGVNSNNNTIISKLKGAEGSNVELQIYRPSENKIITKIVTRGKVPIKSVDIVSMIDRNLGYIRVDRFSRNTYDEFESAMTTLIDSGMKSLILDLRDNPGGFMHIAKQISDEFLEKDKLIVYTKNRKEEIDEEFSTRTGQFKTGKLYILINENSASASEVVAGALQDNDRGIIIGRRSFGKGLVQQELDLGDGSAVRLTTARYYTPTGRSIQKPYSEGNDAYYNDYNRRLVSGELINADSIVVDKKLMFTTPKGKIVYGGGGITPDVFVPVDTTHYSSWLYTAISYSNLNEYFLQYTDGERSNLEKLGYDSYIVNFDKDGSVYNGFIEYLNKQGIKTTEDKKEVNILKLKIKAFISNLVWGEKESFSIWKQMDPYLIKVNDLENNTQIQ